MSGWKNILVAVSTMMVLLLSLWFASRTVQMVAPVESPPLHPVEMESAPVEEDTVAVALDTLPLAHDTIVPSQPDSPPLSQHDTQAVVAAPAASRALVIPVAGIRQEQLNDNYQDARSDGRTHQAIDIMADRGTPVLAAADGRIARLFQSDLGGTTIYQMSADSIYIFYYAHLERYAEGLRDGQMVRRGDVIGYVGDSGNAGEGNYHLHFAIWRIIEPGRYWEGENINPYPVLRGWNRLGEREPVSTGGSRLK